MMGQVLGYLCAVFLAGGLTLAQERAQEPSFKTGVQVVRIDVSVLDGKRRPVRGLQASDFTVLEDNQPRPIRGFTAVDLAAGAAGPPATAPLASRDVSVATNRAGDDTSRLIFIVMDRSIPTERPMIIARQIADAAVDAMAPGDLAAIVTTGVGLVPQNLTSDRTRLHKTIASSDWSQQLSQAQMDDPIIGRLMKNAEDGRCMCGLCVMDTITRIANAVRDVPRRKVMLFVGSNIIVQVGTPAMNNGLSCDKLARDSREALFDALGASGLTVHSIDPQGLASVGPATRATVVNGIENRDSPDLRAQLTLERNDFMKAQGNLDVLPALTGGRTILNTNEPFSMVPDVLHESDAYYLVAFEPLETTGDLRHTIDVKVARPGVDVHSARYISPTGAAAAATPLSPLDRALTSLIPNASLPLDVMAASFAAHEPGRAYVGVTLDASSFAAAAGLAPLEIAVVASDARGGTVASARQRTTIDVPSTIASDTARAPVEVHSFLTLPPGDYELRAAVMNTATHAASSVFTHVTVPAFEQSRLSLSDLIVGTRENQGTLPEAAPAISVVPTTARTFAAGAHVSTLLRVYRAEDKSGKTQPITVDTTILDAIGKTVDRQSEPLDDAKFSGRSADVRAELPLLDLDPGQYLLRIEVSQGSSKAARTLAFTVRR